MMLDDIASRLTTAYSALVTPQLIEGTNLFKSWMPDDPDFIVALYEYSGGPGEGFFLGATPRKWEVTKLQVVVRDARDGYENARTFIERLINFLDTVDESTITGARYMHIHPQGSPMELQPDSRTRVLLATDFEIMKEPTTVSSP